MNTRYYEVAGHVFCVTAEEEDFGLMMNYEPFRCNTVVSLETIFTLSIEEGEIIEYNEEMRQDEEGQEIICGHTPTSPVFEFRWGRRTAGWLVASEDFREARLVVTEYSRKMAIDNALMVMYAMATANKWTVLFHAAAVCLKGHAYIFLGKSGTGKSTHASLWIKYIEGTELVNDDNPVVRVMDNGQVIVYGTPWSGKTPCYRKVNYPLKGIVLLSQAPYNKIERLKSIMAYASIVPSISGMRWNPTIADGLHQTENALASTIAIWHLDCLPDEEAARVCHENIANDE